MFDLDAIKSAKGKADTGPDKPEENYTAAYNQALTYLRDFTETQDESDLKKSAAEFFKALRFKKNNIKPYLYLAYIFYLFEENKLAAEYLEVARAIDPSCTQLLELQNLLG